MSDAGLLLLVAPFLFWFGWLERGRRDRHRRASRRGGYLKPLASAPMRDGGQPTPVTDTLGLISSYSPLGSGLAALGFLPPPHLRNRPDAPGSFGTLTVVPGGNGEPQPLADFGEYCRCGAHVVGTPCYWGEGDDSA